MTPWKLPLIVFGLVVPIVAGFMVAGPALGVALGAIAVVGLLAIAVRERPRGPIGAEPADGGPRRVLIATTRAVEAPGDVARIAEAAELNGASGEDEVRLLVPARIRFLDRWASDVEGARHRAQQHLVVTVAALAKAGIPAEARVGDEDIVQAIEDQLQSFPATEVVLASGAEDKAEGAAVELRSRLRGTFRQVRLGDAQQV
jgi:hypothetical protein